MELQAATWGQCLPMSSQGGVGWSDLPGRYPSSSGQNYRWLQWMIFSKKKRPSFRQGSMRSCIPLLEFCIKLIPGSESFKWKVPKSKAQQEETALDSLDPLLEQGQLEVISRVAVSPLSHCLSNHKKLLVFPPPYFREQQQRTWLN